MKKPFDTIVGPKGVWKDDVEVVGEDELSAREDYVRRCLNAAVNLYGVLTMDEFVSLYNRYAKGHEPTVARPMTREELEGLVDRLIEFCELIDEDESDSIEDIVDRPDCWFDVWNHKETGQKLIVQDQFTMVEPDGTPKSLDEFAEDVRRTVEKLISQTLADFAKVEMKILPEDEFLEYEEPMYSEETEETRKFVRFLVDDYALDEDTAEFDVWGIQGDLRSNGASVTQALEFIRDQCDWRPEDYEDVDRLIREISPVVGVTRTWDYRGHTEEEMCLLGLIDTEIREDIPDVFGVEDVEDADEGFFLDDLPKPVYNGPIDFRFVKDTARREAKMTVYEDVRQVLDGFTAKYFAKDLVKRRMPDAAVRLGYLKPGDGIESLPFDRYANLADFVAVLDDTDGGPIVRQLEKRKGEMDGFDQLALEYFSNARFTWLVIEAVKAGYGMKCRDLMTGEEMFVMEKSGSVGDIKGQTLCAGLMPMEDVYLSTGVGMRLYLRDPEAELGKVLSQMGLLNVRPVQLSFHDQARFFEATVRHLEAMRGRA